MAGTQAEVAQERSLPLLDHLARVGRRSAELAMEPGGLRPRHLVALRLINDEGPIGQQALADALSLDPSNVVGLLNELEERGLVTRRRDPADRRRHIVEIAAAGADELAAGEARIGQVEDDLLRALSPAERATLYDLLVRAAAVSAQACTTEDIHVACLGDEDVVGPC